MKNLAQKVLLNRILSTVFGILLFCPESNAFISSKFVNKATGAPKTAGPSSVKPGSMVKIDITNVDAVNDPKIQCSPENSEWAAMRDFSGNNPVILFFPSADSAGKTFTFVVAGNKDNKTVLTLHTITVEGVPKPVPPEPKPVPPEPKPAGKYTDVLTPAYMVSPDEDSLIKLIMTYEAVADQSSKLTSYKQCNDVLAAATTKVMGETPGNRTKLVAVRDKVANILQADLANRNSTVYDSAATKALFLEIAKSLKPLVKNQVMFDNMSTHSFVPNVIVRLTIGEN